jgi:threonine dehydrogenase-like Zn-dependent dehydrogenase
MSIAEKAIDEAVRLQMARLPGASASSDWLCGRRCLVAGLGPIGLLVALVLSLHDATVCGLDVVDADTARPRWLAGINGSYIDGRQVGDRNLSGRLGTFDVIVDATGRAPLEFKLLDALTFNGVYVLTGLPRGHRLFDMQGAEFIRQLVLRPYGKTDLGFASVAGYVGPVTAQRRAAYKGGRSC